MTDGLSFVRWSVQSLNYSLVYTVSQLFVGLYSLSFVCLSFVQWSVQSLICLLVCTVSHLFIGLYSLICSLVCTSDSFNCLFLCSMSGSAVKKRALGDSLTDSKKVDLHDPGIWNSEELSVLRGVFRAAKSQICSLEVKLRQTQRHNAELEEKLASQSKALEMKTKKLSEATKANHRFVSCWSESTPCYFYIFFNIFYSGNCCHLNSVTIAWKHRR